jgi:hypothetical protein
MGKTPHISHAAKPDDVGANLHSATVIATIPGLKDWVPAEFT